MTHHDGRSDFERDLIERQRNVVFPDTVANEGRFWRGLLAGGQKLTRFQRFALAVVLVAVAVTWSLALGLMIFGLGTYGGVGIRIAMVLFPLAAAFLMILDSVVLPPEAHVVSSAHDITTVTNDVAGAWLDLNTVRLRAA